VHRKIIIPESRFGFTAFADYYHYGPEPGDPVPFIIYIGGLIAPEIYRQRTSTEPSEVRNAFEKALDVRQLPIDFMVIPNPIHEDSDLAVSAENFRLHLIFDLLPQTQNARPFSMGIVGYSLGAYLATSLGLVQPQVRAVSVVGGTEMATAIEESQTEAAKGKHFMAFVNGDDPFSMESYGFMRMLINDALSVDVELGEGGHEFNDYIANGFAAQAFTFVLNGALE
jgi:dienelactone hydrolase